MIQSTTDVHAEASRQLELQVDGEQRVAIASGSNIIVFGVAQSTAE